MEKRWCIVSWRVKPQEENDKRLPTVGPNVKYYNDEKKARKFQDEFVRKSSGGIIILQKVIEITEVKPLKQGGRNVQNKDIE